MNKHHGSIFFGEGLIRKMGIEVARRRRRGINGFLVTF